jgi:hypothetical protein
VLSAPTIGIVKFVWKFPSGPTGALPAFGPWMVSTKIATELPGVNFDPRNTTGRPTSTTDPD